MDIAEHTALPGLARVKVWKCTCAAVLWNSSWGCFKQRSSTCWEWQWKENICWSPRALCQIDVKKLPYWSDTISNPHCFLHLVAGVFLHCHDLTCTGLKVGWIRDKGLDFHNSRDVSLAWILSLPSVWEDMDKLNSVKIWPHLLEVGHLHC